MFGSVESSSQEVTLVFKRGMMDIQEICCQVRGFGDDSFHCLQVREMFQKLHHRDEPHDARPCHRVEFAVKRVQPTRLSDLASCPSK